MDHYQHESEDAENNYSLLGTEESAKYSMVGRMMAETNDDYADPDEEGKGWGQDSEMCSRVQLQQRGRGQHKMRLECTRCLFYQGKLNQGHQKTINREPDLPTLVYMYVRKMLHTCN